MLDKATPHQGGVTNPEPEKRRVRIACSQDFYVKINEHTDQGVITSDFLVMKSGESFILEEYDASGPHGYLYHTTSSGKNIYIVKGTSISSTPKGLYVYLPNTDFMFKISDDENLLQIKIPYTIPGTVSGSIHLASF